MKRLISCFLILSFVALSCTKKHQNHFTLSFQDDIIYLNGYDLTLSAAFKAPDITQAVASNEKWKLNSTATSAMVFGEKAGTLTSDLFISDYGQIERKAWISDDRELVAFQHIFTNPTGSEVKLEALYPFSLSGEQDLFGQDSRYRILTQETQKNGLPGTVFPEAGEVIKSDPFLIINDSINNHNLFIGSQTFYLHLFELILEFNEENEKQIESLLCKCDFEGVTVPPGGSRESQWIVLSGSHDPYKLITDYTKRTKYFHDFKEPDKSAPSVYSAFYYHGLGYNEEYFKSDIAVFRKDPLPFDVFQIDACWQQNYGHDFEYNKEVFPSGMKWAAEQISSLGYVPGIWTGPYIVKIKSETSLAKSHPEWLVKNSKGELCTWIDSYYILDPTHPGVTDYLENSYRKLAGDWGFRYFKFDFMRTIFLDADQQFYDSTATSLEAYRKGLEAIRKGVGGDSYISVCGGHYGASLGIADSQRSGSDTKSFWNEKELPKYRQNILRTWMSGFWHVDPDAMMVRRQKEALPTGKNLTLGLFTDEEAKTNSLNQYIGGGLVCFAEDFAIIDADRKALYRHVIPSINSPSQPLDIFDPVCPNLLLTTVNPVCRELPSWNTVSIVNWTDNPKSYDIEIEKITDGIKGRQFVISEFFTQEIVGIFDKKQTITVKDVQPHQSKLLRIMPWNGKDPVLAGTDLHFSGGGVEISEWNRLGGKVEGAIKTRWNYPVKVTIVFPAENEKGFRAETIRIEAGEKNFTWPKN